MEENNYLLDGVISCSYFIEKDTDFGFALHAYKGRGVSQKRWMAFPLQTLATEFLYNHLECIEECFGKIDCIVPVPGEAESLLTRSEYDNIPVRNLLIDTRDGEHFSSGATREVDKSRFVINKDLDCDPFYNTIILFDDVITTGSTANSAAYTLMKAGALQVILFTVGKRLGNTAEYLPRNKKKKYNINYCNFCG